MKDPNSKYNAQVIERAFAIINVLKDGREIALKDLAVLANINPSTTHRILADLVTSGMVMTKGKWIGVYSINPYYFTSFIKHPEAPANVGQESVCKPTED